MIRTPIFDQTSAQRFMPDDLILFTPGKWHVEVIAAFDDPGTIPMSPIPMLVLQQRIFDTNTKVLTPYCIVGSCMLNDCQGFSVELTGPCQVRAGIDTDLDPNGPQIVVSAQIVDQSVDK